MKKVKILLLNTLLFLRFSLLLGQTSKNACQLFAQLNNDLGANVKLFSVLEVPANKKAYDLLKIASDDFRRNEDNIKKLVEDIAGSGPEFLAKINTEGGIKAWEFVIEGAVIRIKPEVLEKISIALNRGIKVVPYVVSHANHPNIVTYTVEHIFRGHGADGGRHHISALIADNCRKLTNRLKETADGFYDAIFKNADGTNSTKSFWPDTWDENRIMDELKYVMANNPINVTGNTWEGLTTTGQKINYYVKASDNSIISAFPVID